MCLNADAHSHGHEHTHAHSHGHTHDHASRAAAPVLTVRAASGLSGDMILAGLACMLEAEQPLLDALVAELGLPGLHGCLTLEPRSVNQVAGRGCRVDLPHEHAHRTLADITDIIAQSAMAPRAAALAVEAFTLLAGAEARVHGKAVEAVAFHEVGALDSIVDMCVAASLFVRIGAARFVCSPLPMGDGGVFCAHGWIPTPAPAVLELLEGVTVCGFAGRGETVTPTAVALLKAFGAEFGPWPAMRVTRRALVYGTTVFPDAPNGAVWAFGPEL